MLRYLTGGESHGRCITAILEGIPSGLLLKVGDIDKELVRRQKGYGRGGRMTIESDRVYLTSGVRGGMTIGSPITMVVENLDWENWKEIMAVECSQEREGRSEIVTKPRPGHADLAGALKYNHRDIRNILERSSARETVARVAIGAICKRLLEEFGIKVMSWVVEIGGVKISSKFKVQSSKLEDIFYKAENSIVRCPEKKTGKRMIERIDEARKRGDSVGGIFELVVTGLPPGIGSHVHWDRKLDGCLAQAVMSIQAIKGVEAGLGFESSRRLGSEVHDEIFYRSQKPEARNQKIEDKDRRLEESEECLSSVVCHLSSDYWPLETRFYRNTNNAGGIEGGMSNGEPITLRAVMKPIPTLTKALQSVDIMTKKSFKAAKERSDLCAVPAASVVGEAVVAFEIAQGFLDKFGGDSIDEVERNYQGYLEYLRGF